MKMKMKDITEKPLNGMTLRLGVADRKVLESGAAQGLCALLRGISPREMMPERLFPQKEDSGKVGVPVYWTLTSSNSAKAKIVEVREALADFGEVSEYWAEAYLRPMDQAAAWSPKPIRFKRDSGRVVIRFAEKKEE